MTSHSEFSLFEFVEEFNKKFPTDEACLEELQQFVTGGDFTCGSCGHHSPELTENNRCLHCVCGARQWIFSGTFFHGIKKPRAWLAALKIRASKIKINRNQFSKLFGVAYATANDVFKKLDLVILKDSMNELPALVSTEFISVIGKRSRETPAGLLPVEEQEKLDKEHAELEKSRLGSEVWEKLINDRFEDEDKESIKNLKIVYRSLKESLCFDSIVDRYNLKTTTVMSCITKLQLKGFVSSRNPYDCLAETPKKATLDKSTRSLVSSFLSFVKSTYHRISRKYLQLYLAEFWCHSEPEIWGEERILKLFKRARRIKHRDILKYVTPFNVRIPLQQLSIAV